MGNRPSSNDTVATASSEGGRSITFPRRKNAHDNFCVDHFDEGLDEDFDDDSLDELLIFFYGGRMY